jgi:hypothetical protein
MLVILIAGWGLLALVVPGIFLLVRYFLTTPVVVLEQVAYEAALARSADLVRKHWWRTLCAFLLFYFINLVLPLMLTLAISASLPASRPGTFIPRAILSVITTSVFIVLPTIFVVLVYYDMRARKESLHVRSYSASSG